MHATDAVLSPAAMPLPDRSVTDTERYPGNGATLVVGVLVVGGLVLVDDGAGTESDVAGGAAVTVRGGTAVGVLVVVDAGVVVTGAVVGGPLG